MRIIWKGQEEITDNLQMIAENAYRKAKENYTWEQSAKKLLAFIDKIDAQERKCSEK